MGLFNKKTEVKSPVTPPVPNYQPDMEKCKNMYNRIMDILYEDGETKISEWDITLGMVQQGILDAKADVSITRALSRIKMIPFPVGVPVPVEGMGIHEIEASEETVVDSKTRPQSHYG